MDQRPDRRTFLRSAAGVGGLGLGSTGAVARTESALNEPPDPPNEGHGGPDGQQLVEMFGWILVLVGVIAIVAWLVRDLDADW